MAVVFELVIAAGPDRDAAARIAAALTDLPPLPAGSHRIALHPPMIHPVRGTDGAEYHEISLLPVGVGYGVAIERGVQRLPLESAELSELGYGLYDVLRGCRGYRAAIVGWDPEWYLDFAELQEDWADELRRGELDGLVLSDDAVREFAARGIEAAVEPFAHGASWVPYRGERPSVAVVESDR